MADLPIQDIDMGEIMAMAAAQQRKVATWCEEQGIEQTIAPPGYLKEGKYGPPPVDCSHQLYAIVLACLDVPPQSDGERDALRAFVEQSEKVTLQNAIRTWAELRICSNQLNLAVTSLTSLPLAAFIRQHKTRTRAINALKWLVKNLRLPLDLSLVVAPSGPRKVSQFGEGARQAPVLPPTLVTEMGRLGMTDHARWSALFCAHAVIYGVVRFAHLQRSVIDRWRSGL